jgi:hypothetical protein
MRSEVASPVVSGACAVSAPDVSSWTVEEQAKSERPRARAIPIPVFFAVIVVDQEASDADEKPTFASVTTVRCTCDYLQHAAAEPFSPIVFDAEMNEYQITHTTPAGVVCSARIFHCPSCGGAAPRSQRGTRFAHVTSHERARLQELFSSVTTVDAAIAKLGQPDQDMPNGLTTISPATDTEPSQSVSYRVLMYTAISETADVSLTDFGPDRGLRFSLQGKYLGKPKA